MEKGLRNYDRRNVDLIVVHSSGSRETVDYTFAQCIKDHKARGFNGCEYHLFVSRDGSKHIGRHFDSTCHHVQGRNSGSIAICYEGGLDERGKVKDTRTAPQKESLIECILDALEYASGNVKRITGHRNLSNGIGVVEPNEWALVCPCFDAETEYKHLIGAGWPHEKLNEDE